MSLKLTLPEITEMKPRILVAGVGGAGSNAVNNMMRSDLQGVEFLVANTDAQSLANSLCDTRVQLGGSSQHAPWQDSGVHGPSPTYTPPAILFTQRTCVTSWQPYLLQHWPIVQSTSAQLVPSP